MEANGYVELFEDLKARVGSDDVALAIVEQVGKDNRVERMQAGTGSGRNGNGVRNGDQRYFVPGSESPVHSAIA